MKRGEEEGEERRRQESRGEEQRGQERRCCKQGFTHGGQNGKLKNKRSSEDRENHGRVLTTMTVLTFRDRTRGKKEEEKK